ncbi:MAG: hypothetical protein QM581_16585 [Pseudomonas sp.]
MTHSAFHRCIAIVAAAMACAGAMAVQAQEQEPEARTIMPQGGHNQGGRSLSDTIRRVQRFTGGQILGAEQVPFDGRNINRVKYLDDRGRVRYMDDPVQQGRPTPRGPRPAESSDVQSTRGDNR